VKAADRPAHERWVNLGLAGLLLFYVLQILLDVLWGNTCGHLGTDFCAFWSAGKAANAYGYARVYDLALLSRIQLANFPAFGDPAAFAVSPFAYLPIFVLPFQLLAVLPPGAAFWLWTALNAIAFWAYLAFLYRKLLGSRLPTRLFILLALSLPAYWNLLDGQVNVWLMIFLGEFLRHALAGQPFKAGLWLTGLLLKPQSLALLAVLALVRLPRRILAGLISGLVAMGALSTALLGPTGAMGMLHVWLGFSRGMPTNDVDSMMNWRMIGFHISNWTSPPIGWGVAAFGMAATIIGVVALWKRGVDLKSPSGSAVLLGTLAATTLVAWHSHIHMAMILVPAFLLAMRSRLVVGTGEIEIWSVLPALAYVLVFLLAAVIRFGVLPQAWTGSITALRGGAEFAVNIWLLMLALRFVRSATPPTASGPVTPAS
jgi:hypothetical protein